MPSHSGPRINLGLALEHGGRIGDALARCQNRHAQRDEWAEELLQDIMYRGTSDWKSWARTQLGAAE